MNILVSYTSSNLSALGVLMMSFSSRSPCSSSGSSFVSQELSFFGLKLSNFDSILDCASCRRPFAALAYPATVAAALLLVPSPQISLLVNRHVGPGFAAAVGLASLVARNRPNRPP